jgi:DNA polymerase-3 subunit delta
VRVHPKAAALIDGELRPVWAFMGAEPMLVDRAAQAAVARVQPLCEPASFNVLRVSVGDGDPGHAVSAARTLPMMAERRLVVIRGIEAGNEAFFVGLLDYLSAPNPSTTLVLTAGGFPKVEKGGKDWGQRLTKALGPESLCRFDERDASPVGFVLEACAALGNPIAQQDAALLVEVAGTSLMRLEREVDKLHLLVEPGAPLTSAVILEAAAQVAEAVVWDLTTGIAVRDPDRALAALHRLLAEGEAPHKLLGLVLWQLRSVLRAAELIRAGRSDWDVRNETRVRDDVLRAVKAEVSQQPLGAAAILTRVARAARTMNRARAGDDLTLEALVLDLVLRGRRAS